jgi:excisionase family DNA binding protein
MFADYLTSREASQELGINPNTIRNWLKHGKLKGLKKGNIWLISKKNLTQFIKKNAPLKKNDENISIDDLVGIWADRFPDDKESEEIQKEWRTEKWKRL